MKLCIFSPARCGSVLIANVINSLIPQLDILKSHRYFESIYQYHVVSIVRDPLDVVKSTILIRNQGLINQEIIDRELPTIIKQFEDLINVQDGNNVLLLRYESFWNNYDYIFDNFENFFNIKINQHLRTIIKNKLSIEKMKKISQKFNSFDQYDPNTLIHGNHISPQNGQPGCWKTVIPEEYHNCLKQRLEKYLIRFNY